MQFNAAIGVRYERCSRVTVHLYIACLPARLTEGLKIDSGSVRPRRTGRLPRFTTVGLCLMRLLADA